MKKYTFIFAAVAAILLAGCQKEEFSAPSAKQEGGRVVLTATVNQTRSTVSEDGLFAWAEDDVIGVMTDKGNFTPFNLTGGSGTYSATFTSVEQNINVEKVAVFPSNIAKSLSGKTLTVNMPEEIVYVEGRTNSPMVAVMADGAVSNLSFKHLGGLLTLTFNHIPEEAAMFYVTSNTNTLKGDFTIEDYTAAGACIQTGPTPTGKSSSIWVELPEEHPTGPVTFHVPLPVGTYEHLAVGFLDEKYYFCDNETRKTYTNLKVERCDMRTAAYQNKNWEILFDQRGLKAGRTDGRDVFRFQDIPGKWQYTYMMHVEYTGAYYGSSDEKVVSEAAAAVKAATTPRIYEGNYNINFFPFPAKQTVHMFAYQMDDDFNVVDYIHRQWTPAEKETCSEGFNKWLGTWMATGKDEAGNDSTYTLTFTTKANDELYAIEGWAHTGSGQRLQAYYDAATGGITIRTYPFNYQTTRDADGITYHRRFGYYGATAKGFQHANTTLCTGTIDASGTTATLEGYTYYTNSPFVTMGLFYSAYEKNPSTGGAKGWYVKDFKTLIHFPVTLTKVEID